MYRNILWVCTIEPRYGQLPEHAIGPLKGGGGGVINLQNPKLSFRTERSSRLRKMLGLKKWASKICGVRKKKRVGDVVG